MARGIFTWLNKRYPQNIIIKNPVVGTMIFLGFCALFAIIYKPFQNHESRFFGFEATVIIYFIIVAIPLWGIVKLLKRTSYFSNSEEWTILKEILSMMISLTGMGIVIYFSGFLLEWPSERWNLITFFDSVLTAFLIGIIPFMFFTLINYRYLFVEDIIRYYQTGIKPAGPDKPEEMVRIGSQLKKEELSFYPAQLIYAESDGNYVVFHLAAENQVKKSVIRNSINNIQQQLEHIPFLYRTHRAFIVNINKVCSQKGNSLGYRLKLSGIDSEIPVARTKTHDFDQILKQYH